MCGRFSLSSSVADVARQFGVDEICVDELPPRWNVAPTQPVYAVITSPGDTSRQLHSPRWGLYAHRVINLRQETVRRRRSFQARRCLIPANGFYEWHQHNPYYFRSARSGSALLGLAGVWEGDSSDRPESCAILTTRPNRVVAPVHDRMPAIVAPELWEIWLAPEPLEPEEADAILSPAPEASLVTWRVGTLVNSPRREGPELVAPLEEIDDPSFPGFELGPEHLEPPGAGRFSR